MSEPNIKIPVDVTNPGQFLACCGLLELASRLDEQGEGWFGDRRFQLRFKSSFGSLVDALGQAAMNNTMSAAQNARLKELSSMSKKEREQASLENEKKRT